MELSDSELYSDRPVVLSIEGASALVGRADGSDMLSDCLNVSVADTPANGSSITLRTTGLKSGYRTGGLGEKGGGPVGDRPRICIGSGKGLREGLGLCASGG